MCKYGILNLTLYEWERKRTVTDKKTYLQEIYPYLIALLATLFSFIFVFRLKIQGDIGSIQSGMQAAIIGVLLIATYLAYKQELTVTKLIWLIIIAGCIMRIGYMLYTPAYLRYHDVGGYSDDSYGHLTYIYKIYHEKRLPIVNTTQLYQQPLYYILSALMMGFMKFMLGWEEFEASDVVSCIAACFLLIILKKQLEEIKCSNRVKITAIAIFAFFPNFYLMAGRVNNDSLAWCFYGFALYYLFKWWNHPKMKTIIQLALALALGMLSKLSVVTLAFAIAPVFLVVLIQVARKAAKDENKLFYKCREFKSILLQYVVFGAISIPLGLSFSIRQLVKFGQPLGYVLDIGRPAEIDIGNYTIVERLLSINWKNLFATPFANPNGDYNSWVYLVKGSVFGEFTFQISLWVPRLLLLAACILVVFSLFSMVDLIFLKRKDQKVTIVLGWIWLLSIISHIFLVVRYPVACSMDYRYMIPTALSGAIFVAMETEDLRQSKNQYARWCAKVIYGTLFVFVITSIIMYCNIAQ